MSEAEKVVAELRRAIMTGEDGCGTLPAKEAVKVRPADWHRITKLGRQAADLIAHQAARLEEMTRERDRARGLIREKLELIEVHLAALTAAEADKERSNDILRDFIASLNIRGKMISVSYDELFALEARARAALSEKEQGA